jgi:hypothetical protein
MTAHSRVGVASTRRRHPARRGNMVSQELPIAAAYKSRSHAALDTASNLSSHLPSSPVQHM